MKNKSSLGQKLVSYSALATAILGGAKEVDAQILYTDINPNDTTSIIGVFFLDLNNDGITDFKFNVQESSSSSSVYQARVTGMGSNSILRDPLNPNAQQGYFYAPALFSSSVIGGSDSFKSLALLGTFSVNAYGNWPGTTDRFLGLKLVVDSNSYYGWVRLSLNPTCDQLIANDYAVDTVANEPIITGDKCGDYSAFANTVINPPNPVNICGAGNSVALATDSIAGFTYQWTIDGNIISGANGAGYTVDSVGNYSLLATNPYGCVDTANIQVSIVPLPETPVITQTGNSLASSDASAYQWFSNGVLIPGATSQTYNPLQEGNYTVEITDANGCKSISSSFAFILIGISTSEENSMDVFAANNMVFVRLHDTNFLGGHLNISNTLGDEVYFLTVNAENFSIDLQQIPAGIYMITIHKGDNRVSRKITIQ